MTDGLHNSPESVVVGRIGINWANPASNACRGNELHSCGVVGGEKGIAYFTNGPIGTHVDRVSEMSLEIQSLSRIGSKEETYGGVCLDACGQSNGRK
jgi:hypothetical protein